jgi:uncharacterized protein (TIRG00374 family)
MKRIVKPRVLFWLALAILAAWALASVPFAQVGDTLRSLRIRHIAFLLLINVFIFLAFTSRWWLITHAQGYSANFFQLVGYRLASFGISYFTPGTQFGGEPMQVLMLEKRHHISRPAALATVSLDKLFEVLANFTFLLIGLLTIINGGLLPAMGRPIVIAILSLLLGIPLLYLGALWLGAAPVSILSRRLGARWHSPSKLSNLAATLAETEVQITALLKRSPMTVLWIVPLSGLIWLLMLGEYMLTLLFLGARVDPLQALIALTAARLAFLTPLPGGLGALEASQALALGALGFSPALGISVSLLIRGRDIAFGLIGLWWGALLTRRTAPIHQGPPRLGQQEF